MYISYAFNVSQAIICTIVVYVVAADEKSGTVRPEKRQIPSYNSVVVQQPSPATPPAAANNVPATVPYQPNYVPVCVVQPYNPIYVNPPSSVPAYQPAESYVPQYQPSSQYPGIPSYQPSSPQYPAVIQYQPQQPQSPVPSYSYSYFTNNAQPAVQSSKK